MYLYFVIKMPLKINLKEKKISIAHPSYTINHSGIHSANNQNSSMTLNLVIIFFLISSGAAFTSNSQEIQGRLSTDTGIILELAYKYILHISNNHPLAC